MPSTSLGLVVAAALSCFAAAERVAATEIRLLAGAVVSSQTAAGPTHPAGLSQEGRFVLLRSLAPNLIPSQVDTNGAADLFLRDRQVDGLTLITHTAGAESRTASGGSQPVAMSPDGEYVLFHSSAGDLIAELTRASPYSTDVYLWRRSTATLTLVSHLPGQPSAAAGQSRGVALSPDGEFVLFESEATGLVSGAVDTNRASDVFLFSRSSGEVRLISAAAPVPRGSGSNLKTGNGPSTAVALRNDGSEVLFSSFATDLVVDGSGPPENAFVWSSAGGTISRLVNLAANTVPRAFTPDGRYVLLEGSDDTVLLLDRQNQNLRTLGSGNGARAVALSAAGDRALFDLDYQTYLYLGPETPLLCLSCDSSYSYATDLSADGRFVLFAMSRDNIRLLPYLYDHLEKRTLSVFPPAATTVGAGGGFYVGMTPDASYLVAASREAGLDPAYDDRNGNFDTFIVRRGDPSLELLSPAAWPGPLRTTLGGSSNPTGQSADREDTLFWGPAYLLDPQNPTDSTAAWAYHLATGERRLLSPLPGQPQIPAPGWSSPLALARDGRVLLTSSAADLVPGAVPGTVPQLYLYSPASQSYRLISERAGEPGHGTTSWLADYRFDAELSKVLFTGGGADLVAGLEPLTSSNLFACNLAGPLPGCRLLSVDAGDAHRGADRSTDQLSVSRDLTVAVFGSAASNLVPAVGDGYHEQTYVWREGQGIALLSRSAGHPEQAASGSTWPNGISADGRFVVATSYATDLDPAVLDGNGTTDVYLYDAVFGSWELLSTTASSPLASANGFSGALAISADGRFVLFFSSATDLVPGQIDGSAPYYPADAQWDLFWVDRNTRQKRLVSHFPGQPQHATGFANFGCLSEDGSQVALVYSGPAPIPNSPESLFGIHSWESSDGELQQLVHGTASPFPWATAWPLCVQTHYFDGSILPISSWTDNLGLEDSNGWADAYVVLLDGLFRDGFEAGNTSAWSATVP